ncbi:Tetratricopeptide repeat protein 4-like protein [Drosera capensis]
MALWMEAGSEPKTDEERADLEAISALKEAAAVELKEKGNEYVKKGKKHFVHAIDCYTRAINQQVLSEKDTSVLFANRAHVNLLLGNNRRALEDAQQAIKLSQTNIKSFYRAAKASLSLGFLREAKSYCEKGLEVSPENEELRKLLHQVNSKLLDLEKREIEALKSLKAAKDLVSAIGNRGLRIGKGMHRELTGPKKPILDDNNILHWPVVLLYAEVMSSDLIEDFCETDICLPLPWDKEKAYTRDSVELYYEIGMAVALSEGEILHYLLEGTAGSGLANVDEEKGSSKNGNATGFPKWVKVNEKRTLHDVLQALDFIIPGVPVFYVVSQRSHFYKDFKAEESMKHNNRVQ